jgi:radical SAM-linked protein
LKYISHLDFLRLLKRTCRRASLPIAATSGFSPQLKVALSHALPLGLESEAEFADIELTQHMNEEEFTHILNESLPEGARILAARNIPLHSRSVEDISTHSLFLLRLDAFSLKEREEVLSSLKKKEIERWIVDAKVEADTLFLWLSHKIGVRKFFSLLSCPFPLFSIKRLEQFCLLAGKLLPVIEVI